MPTPRPQTASDEGARPHGRSIDGDGLYVAVVLDHRLGSVDSWGPLAAPRAVRVLDDLRALLASGGVTDVTVTVCRLHAPGRPGHPDDP